MTNEVFMASISKGEFKQLALRIIEEYLANNISLFERDEILRRSRVLEAFLRDEYKDLHTPRLDTKAGEELLAHVQEFLEKLFPDDDFVIEAVPSENEDGIGLPIYQIRSYPSDPTLEVIKTKWDRGDYILPEFQRGWVWNATQASRLIESFLAGLPVPPIFVHKETRTGKEVVIDGQQRLRTIIGFIDGKLPDGSQFKLRGVTEKWEGKYYSTLKENDASNFRSSVLRVLIVEQIDPQDVSSIYEIFARLNTGGTALSAQEVRNASYHGLFNDMLKQINLDSIWRKIFGKNQPDARMRDIELILRFFALYETKYEKPMKGFINEFMGRHKNDTSLQQWEDLFLNTVKRVNQSLGDRPFHITRGINSSVFDSVMVSFAKSSNEPKDLQERYHRLVTSKKYRDLIYVSTTDTNTVNARIEIAREVLFS
jgi:hypothetical protein